MNQQQAVKILKQHNAWRRGDEIPQLDPKDVGEAIDTAVRLLSKKPEKGVMFRWRHSTKPSVFEVWEDGVRVYSGPYKQAPYK